MPFIYLHDKLLLTCRRMQFNVNAVLNEISTIVILAVI